MIDHPKHPRRWVYRVVDGASESELLEEGTPTPDGWHATPDLAHQALETPKKEKSNGGKAETKAPTETKA